MNDVILFWLFGAPILVGLALLAREADARARKARVALVRVPARARRR